jgi:hypothetical protein
MSELKSLVEEQLDIGCAPSSNERRERLPLRSTESQARTRPEQVSADAGNARPGRNRPAPLPGACAAAGSAGDTESVRPLATEPTPHSDSVSPGGRAAPRPTHTRTQPHTARVNPVCVARAPRIDTFHPLAHLTHATPREIVDRFRSWGGGFLVRNPGRPWGAGRATVRAAARCGRAPPSVLSQ